MSRERRDDDRPAPAERPALRVVGDGDAADEGADEAPRERVPRVRVRDREKDRSGARASDLSALDEARGVLASLDAQQYHRSLSGLVREGHDSVLGPLPFNPGLEFHDPSRVVVDPRPTGLETVELYARAAYPDFDDVLVPAFRDPLVARELTAVHHLLSEGANVALVTNHGQIIDIALVLGALILAMCDPDRTYGVLGERVDLDQLSPHLNLMVSRMVTTRQVFNVPALQVIQQCGSRVFLSVPQTASRRRAKLDPAAVRANNVVVRHELDMRLSEGGQLLAMAASGSQDLSLAANLAQKVRTQWRQRRGTDPGDADTLHLQPLYDGTIQLMQSCRYVMPVAVCLDPRTPAVVVGDLTRVREKEDCHRVMDWIAEAHQEATSIPTIYHRQEDDLLTHVRSLVKF